MIMDKVFKVLGDPTRRGILRLLRSGDMSAGRTAEEFPIAKSTLFGHLNVLKEADLVVTERNGTTITYSLNVYEEMLGDMRPRSTTKAAQANPARSRKFGRRRQITALRRETL